MKKGGLEIAVLLVGALVIIGSLLVKFIFDLPATQTLIISNIIFSVGFLIYILYSIMNTNNLNKEIRGLNAHIAGLKKEITKKDKEIAEQKQTIASQEKENNLLKEETHELQEQIKGLKKELEDIRSSENEAGQ